MVGGQQNNFGEGQAQEIKRLQELQETIHKKDAYISQVVELVNAREVVIGDQEHRLRLLQEESHRLSLALGAVHDSFAWRAIAPLRKLGGLYRDHFKRTIVYGLVPHSQIKQTNSIKYPFVSTGEDPWFTMEEPKQRYPNGWAVIELMGTSEKGQIDPRVYIDYGQGFSEEMAVTLFEVSNNRYQRAVYIAHAINALRLDPMDASGKFWIEGVKIKRISARSAFFRMSSFVRKASRMMSLKCDIYGKCYARHKKKGVLHMMEALFRDYEKRGRELANVTTGEPYETWIERVENKRYKNQDLLAQEMAAFLYRPLISVVMPTYNTDSTLLKKCIDSVMAQSYDNWELCIADDASPDKHVVKILEQYATREPRVRYTVRKKNGHISEASNSALELVKGEFVALLDHDDELSPHALFEIVKELNAYPDADILYSDEDKINEKGIRCEPHFKSDWNPALLYSQNYISHLGVYRTELIKKVGGFRKGVEGSQDYDLLLRCVAQTDPEKIRHIPWVLYHWRAVEGSTALAPEEKSYTTTVGIKALEDFFSKQDRKVDVTAGILPNTYRIGYQLPVPLPLVSILIPTRDGYDILKTCIDSILEKTRYDHYELIVLDNQSTDPITLVYLDEIQKHPKIRVLRYDHPFNYSAINNFGAKQAKGEILGLVNNDIEVISPDWLDELVSLAVQPEYGCVGAKLYYPNDTIQHAGVVLGIGGVAGHSHKFFVRSESGYFSRLMLRQNFSAVTAACLLIRKEIYDELNGLDENLQVAFNDIDFCLRVREAGYMNVWTPYAELYHHESVSRGAEDNSEKQDRFDGEVTFMTERWGDLLNTDPFYSPNLTKDREDFSIF